MRTEPLSAMVPIPTLASSFDRAARNYDAHAQVQTAMADWLAEWLPAPREGRALEIGAGPGVFTRRLLPWRGSLLATDISPAMCAAGREALPQVTWQTLAADAPGRISELAVAAGAAPPVAPVSDWRPPVTDRRYSRKNRRQPGDAADAPEGGPWDWIFCSSMLQWVAEPEEIFAGWRRCLAGDGRVLAGLFVADTLPEWRELTGEPDPLIWRTAEEWRASLARSGLRVVRDAVERRVFRHASALALLRSLHGTGAAPERRLSPGRLRRLLREYDSRHGSSEGVGATWTFYRFEARSLSDLD